MLRILIVISVLLPLAHFEYDYDDYPGRMYSEKWGHRMVNARLVNLTEHLCRDAMYKLRMAEKVTDEYRKSFGYHLGLLTAGILDRFNYMMKIYRYYSNNREFKNHTHTLDQLLGGYSGMQSSYAQIRAEANLYHEVEGEQMYSLKKTSKKKKSKQPILSDNLLKKLKQSGIDTTNVDLENLKSLRRGMNIHSFLWDLPEKLRKTSGNDWIKKDNRSTKEDEFKRELRYIKWAEKWDGFNPEIEGVHIPDRIARIGLNNDSNFLQKELKLV